MFKTEAIVDAMFPSNEVVAALASAPVTRPKRDLLVRVLAGADASAFWAKLVVTWIGQPPLN